jgi:hypothetical protein
MLTASAIGPTSRPMPSITARGGYHSRSNLIRGMRTLRPTKPALALLALLVVPITAAAEPSLIKQPGAHPDYTLELEPHAVFGFDPPGKTAGKGFGPGFRGTFEIIDNGFIQSINNTVGIGFGLDWFAFSDGKTSLWAPLVMQWNFWLTRSWSVFGEPGAGIYLGNATGVRPAFYGGGRFHFSDALALTIRVGYPTASVGLSFVL